MRWENVQVNPIQGQGGEGGELFGPGKRWGHTCNAIRGGRFLYVFGGYGKDNCQTNQVHVFDTVKHAWSQPLIKGTPPAPRDSHSCTAVGDNLFVFGGTDGANPLKDLHILDTSSHTWITPTIRGEGPEAREGHSAALVGKRLYIFGGCGKSADNNDEVYYNDLYILNTGHCLELGIVTCLACNICGKIGVIKGYSAGHFETFVWKCATTSGTPPSPRDSHTCSSWKNKVIVVGGEDGHDYYLSDVHILDTDTLIWRELNMSGQLLPARAGHSTVSFGKNLFVFGGFADAQNLYNDLYMLDVDTGIWTKMAATGDGPSARFSVAGDCLDPCMGGVLVFIGGCNKSLEALDDMYYLYTGLGGESEQRPEKLSLRKQLKLKCQEQNVNPVQGQAPLRYGVVANISQPMTMLGYSQPSRQNIPLNQSFPGKKMFQAKVTESISEGYTIETVIDGKPLRGILFLNRPSLRYPATHTSNRKRTADETGSGVSNGMHPNKLRNSTLLKQDEMEDRQVDGVHGHSSASHEHLPETVASVLSSNPRTSDVSELHKIASSPVSEDVLLNQNDDNRSDTLKFLAENLKNEGKNDVPSSKTGVPTDNQINSVPSANYEVPRYDQPSNAPSCNIEVLKPAAVENVCLSSPGRTTAVTEERNAPAT